MRVKWVIWLLGLSLVLGVNPVFANSHKATVAECISMCKQAAEMILADQEAGLAEIAKRNGKFVWKDSYVFAMNLKGKMFAHPMMPGLMKMDSLLTVTDKNPKNPKMLFVDFVVKAATEGEGWIEYMWPKPDSSEPAIKETYIYRVPGTSIFVGAGIYRD